MTRCSESCAMQRSSSTRTKATPCSRPSARRCASGASSRSCAWISRPLPTRTAAEPRRAFRAHGSRCLRAARVARLHDSSRSRGSTWPDLRDRSWSPLAPARIPTDDIDIFAVDPRWRRACPPPVRKLRPERRAVHRRRGGRSADAGHQDDGLSRRRRYAFRALAHPRGGGRQAGRVPRRAEGAVRRSAQHALGAGDGEGRRPRGLWRARAQDPHQTRPRGAQGKPADCGATPISAPATTT